MVKITDKTTEDFVYFPKNLHSALDNHTLTIKSCSTLEETTLSLVDYGDVEDYYKFMYDWTVFKDGEYEYTIDNKEYGLIQFGKAVETARQERKEYNKIDTNKIYYGE